MMAKARYTVRFSVRGRFSADVLASTLEEAKEEALHLFEEEDIGNLSDVDGDFASVEDAAGNTIWQG